MKRLQEVQRRNQKAALSRITVSKFMECRKNHATDPKETYFDGCEEFVKKIGAKGNAAVICATCGCPKGCHRKVVQILVTKENCNCSSEPSTSGR